MKIEIIKSFYNRYIDSWVNFIKKHIPSAAIMFICTIVSTIYAVKTFYITVPVASPPAQIKNITQTDATNPRGNQDDNNPIKGNIRHPAHSHTPPAPQSQQTASTIEQKGNILNGPNYGTYSPTYNENIRETYPIERWCFDGSKEWLSAPNHHNFAVDLKKKEFDEMLSLHNSKLFNELAIYTKKQISETPKWLTPYLFLGVAQANMGLKEEAIKNLKYVESNYNNTTCDPDESRYKEATRILKLLSQ